MARSRQLSIRRWLDETHVIDFTVSWSAGGINYATYKQNPRGYVVSFRPKEVSEGCEKYMMFDDKAGLMLLEPAVRFNQKRLTDLILHIQPRINDAVPLVVAGDTRAALLLLTKGEYPADASRLPAVPIAPTEEAEL